MAWYRCGGGGLPAGLQSDMDTVLNKKLGTSTTYPPTDWPDTVNLMGPLPEKTASGAIANITDGADGVPLKNWLVTLPASLDGYSEVNGVQSGKNLLDGEDAVKTANNIRFYYTSGKYYLAGTYTLSISESVSGLYVRNVSTSTNIVTKYNSNFVTFTLTEKTLIGFDFYKVGINQYDNVMLEVGSTATEFVSYEAPTQYTASLGRTIYGGQADIVTGEGEDENGNAFTFTPITPTPETALGVNNFWADEGDTEVTYRADISLALQALGGGGRGLMMMRPTEPEETEETEETEGLEDELNR